MGLNYKRVTFNMLYDLYPHQEKAIEMLRESFKNGLTRPVMYAPTGSGKTLISAQIVENALNRGKRVLFIAPYITLINQTAKSFMDQGLPKPGIIQADHPWLNPAKRLQIASIQTLARREWPETDLIIVDEAHILWAAMTKYLDNYDTPCISLTATPFTKGMGKYYNNLIKPTSMNELTENGFLSPYIAYSHDRPDLKGIKIVAGEYHEGQLGDKMCDPKIIGCAVSTWLKHGNNEQTVCFCVNVAHANFVSTEFDKVNVTNAVITGMTPADERAVIFKGFDNKSIKVIINVFCLTAGWDSDVRCMIDLAPTKSNTRHTQKIGRICRTAKGKEYAILLDHAGNIINLGFPEDLEIDELCNGNKADAAERKEKQAQEKKEKQPKECGKCKHLKKAGEFECPKCGFAPKFIENVEVEDGELTAIKTTNKHEKTEKYNSTDKKRIFSELKGYQRERQLRGKPISDTWVNKTYQEMVGVEPRGMSNNSITPSEQVRGFIKHKFIKYSKSRKLNAKYSEWSERRND